MAKRSECSANIEEAVEKFYKEKTKEIDALIERNAKLDLELDKIFEQWDKKIEANKKLNEKG